MLKLLPVSFQCCVQFGIVCESDHKIPKISNRAVGIIFWKNGRTIISEFYQLKKYIEAEVMVMDFTTRWLEKDAGEVWNFITDKSFDAELPVIKLFFVELVATAFFAEHGESLLESSKSSQDLPIIFALECFNDFFIIFICWLCKSNLLQKQLVLQ